MNQQQLLILKKEISDSRTLYFNFPQLKLPLLFSLQFVKQLITFIYKFRFYKSPLVNIKI